MKKLFLPAWLGLVVLPATLLAAPFKFFEPLQPPRPVQVMAHRGAAGQAPENTRPALLRCIEDGFEWAEVDVRLSRDGQHVLWHDAELDRLGSAGKKVNELTLAELRALDAGAWFARRYTGERLLTLREALALARGKLNLYLDCKDVNLELLTREILDAGMETQVVVYQTPERLKTFRSISQNKIAVLAHWHPADGFEGWVKSLDPEAVEIDANEITPPIAERFHRLGIKVETMNLGHLDRAESWDRSIRAGVDWIQTDLPEEVIAHCCMQRVPKRPVLVSFHRGANHYAPENTLPAFAKAARLSADYVEFDVRTTRDGKFFLLHDGQLDRTSNGLGPLAQATAEEIAKLDAGGWFGRPFAGLPLPSLDEFLTAVPPSVQLYFDAKAITPEALSAAVERHHLADRTIVYQSADYLIKLKAINSRIRALPPLGRAEDIDPLAAKLQPYAVDAKWSILSKEVIDRCHAHGIKVFSDALGANEKIEQYQQAIDWGIDLIQTDHPLRVYRAMELRAATGPKARK
jgi:glycerophosphoryl diester phosphodiesterase